MNRIWFVYIVECRDKSLYTGISPDVEERVNKHNSKKGAKSILGKLPVRLVYKQEIGMQGEAAKREREIKGWSRNKKLELIKKSGLSLMGLP